MGFMQSYKRLDSLCRDVNGVGISGYIDDMGRKADGQHYVSGWREDYFTLKRYRYIRNRIAHDTYAEEQELCTSKDEMWLEGFCQRILTQEDPITVLKKRKTISASERKRKEYALLESVKETSIGKETFSPKQETTAGGAQNEKSGFQVRGGFVIMALLLLAALCAAWLFFVRGGAL